MEKDKETKQIYGQLVNRVIVAEDALRVDDFEPFGHCVLVEPLPADTKTAGGIHLPGNAVTQKSMGVVVRISPKDVGGPFELGDLVMYLQDSGYEIEVEGRKLLVLQYQTEIEGEILGKWPARLFDK